jgi:hypothetical protein
VLDAAICNRQIFLFDLDADAVALHPVGRKRDGAAIESQSSLAAAREGEAGI